MSERGPLRKLLENFVGLPDLDKVERVVAMLRELTKDEKALRQAGRMVEAVRGLAREAPDLDKVIRLMEMVREAHRDGSLKQMTELTRSVEGVLRKLPLDIGELVSEIREEVRKTRA